jgi:hypothetical protein
MAQRGFSYEINNIFSSMYSQFDLIFMYYTVISATPLNFTVLQDTWIGDYKNLTQYGNLYRIFDKNSLLHFRLYVGSNFENRSLLCNSHGIRKSGGQGADNLRYLRCCAA